MSNTYGSITGGKLTIKPLPTQQPKYKNGEIVKTTIAGDILIKSSYWNNRQFVYFIAGYKSLQFTESYIDSIVI